jgi:putative Mg2+ transporter-C (MgtC) family protein
MGVSEQLDLVVRVVLGALLGYLIGLERAFRGKDAGDRTFALLALGSAAFVGLGIELFPDSADRVIQGVAAGVGFLGAGVIFRSEHGTRGLTTAAASWAAASIGSLAGAGIWLAATAITVLTLLVLEAHQVGFLERLGRPADSEEGSD